CRPSTSADAPVTCGVAIDVPLRVARAVSLLPLTNDDTMLTPGAKMSTQVPKLENEARLSLASVAPTVIAAPTRAGESLHAFWFSLPAAIAYVTPALIERCTAASRAALAPPPRLMFATAGLIAFLVTQSTPLITPAFVPLPLQSSTRTATSFTALASPTVEPPTVPETCVPWPLQAWPLRPSPTVA